MEWNETVKNETASDCWNVFKSKNDCIIDTFVPLKNRKKSLEKSMMWQSYIHIGSEQDNMNDKEAERESLKRYYTAVSTVRTS